MEIVHLFYSGKMHGMLEGVGLIKINLYYTYMYKYNKFAFTKFISQGFGSHCEMFESGIYGKPYWHVGRRMGQALIYGEEKDPARISTLFLSNLA